MNTDSSDESASQSLLFYFANINILIKADSRHQATTTKTIRTIGDGVTTCFHWNSGSLITVVKF